MIKIAFYSVLLFLFAFAQDRVYTLDELQGAWWGLDDDEPTATFVISEKEFWMDYDSQFHPLTIENGHTLIFDFEDDATRFTIKILSLDKDTLIVKYDYLDNKTTLIRKKD